MNRGEAIGRLREGRRWDVLIIGGGATGLAAALDAASRGYRTLLVERGDFASGTSSRSTKLIHGGVRYLRQGRLGLVRSALLERTRLLRNAPGLVHPREFLPGDTALLIPRTSDGRVLFAIPWHGRVLLGTTDTEVKEIAREPTPGATEVDYLLRHAARYLARAPVHADVLSAFAGLRPLMKGGGGPLLNYAPVTSLLKAGGRIAGAVLRDEETGETFEAGARAVINATGVFSDELRRLDEAAAAPRLAPSQGAHLVLPREFLPGDTALLIPRTSDGRVLFAIPWHGRVLLGTTDTEVKEIAREPTPGATEVDYLLRHAARYLARAPVHADVLSAFAGLRPLMKGGGGPTSALSRDHVITVSPSGLVTIAGGKWTTARRMAEDVVTRAATLAGLPARPCRTAALPVPDPLPPRGAGAACDDALLAAAVRITMARTVEDVLARRTRALHEDARTAMTAAPRVAAFIAPLLGHDGAWQARQVAAFHALAARHLPSPAGRPHPPAAGQSPV
ncbi:MAG: glycerol-3-phosphate dehydrogenase/oxidase [Opitutae bacterium]|nr:glycerol-3-phosphate dehydrogenase/oxidase [Opitutae bacterium]